MTSIKKNESISLILIWKKKQYFEMLKILETDLELSQFSFQECQFDLQECQSSLQECLFSLQEFWGVKVTWPGSANSVRDTICLRLSNILAILP